MKPYFFFAFIFVTASIANSQVVTGRGKPDAKEELSQGYKRSDTMSFSLQPVTIYSSRIFKNKRLQNQYNRLVNHVKKVYPYAKQASIVLREEEAKMVGMDKSEKKAHMKNVEKRIENEFGGELKDLTFTQGRILLKLIDRETGYTSYELVDDLRGTFRAWFYDGIAGLFGYDLKSDFNPQMNLEDRYIDEIVKQIETDQISLK